MTNTHLTDLFSVGASEKREKAKKSRKWGINVLGPNHIDAFMIRMHPGRMLTLIVDSGDVVVRLVPILPLNQVLT